MPQAQSGAIVTTSEQIAAGIIINSDINSAAAIAYSKLAALTSANLLVGDASNVPTVRAVTGDVTIDNSGVTAIGSSRVTEAMQLIADNTTNNVTASAHGYVPKIPNNTTTFLRGDATFAAAGGGGWTLVEEKNIASASTSETFASLTARKVFMLVLNLKVANADTIIGLRLNGDSGSNYSFMSMNNPTATNNVTQTSFKLLRADTDDIVAAAIIISGEKVSNEESNVNGIVHSTEGATGRYAFIGGDYAKTAETEITSIVVVQTTGATGYTGNMALYFSADIA